MLAKQDSTPNEDCCYINRGLFIQSSRSFHRVVCFCGVNGEAIWQMFSQELRRRVARQAGTKSRRISTDCPKINIDFEMYFIKYILCVLGTCKRFFFYCKCSERENEPFVVLEKCHLLLEDDIRTDFPKLPYFFCKYS